MIDKNPQLPNRDWDDERLDDLVCRASRTEVDRLSVERLTREWRREMDAPSRARVWLPLAAAACIAFLATAVVLFVSRPSDDDRQEVQVNGRTEGPDFLPDRRDPRSAESPKLAGNELSQPSIAEDATPYERLVMVAAIRQLQPTQPNAPRSVRRNLVDRLSSMDQVDDDSVEQLATDLGVSLAELEQEAGRLCLVLRGKRRESAIKLLSHVATRQSFEVLMRLWSKSALQNRLTPVLARLAGRDELANCYVRAASSESRKLLAVALVEQMRPSDAGLLMELLASSSLTMELLVELRHADASLAAPLFAALDHQTRTVRYTAARALGALHRPEVTSRLVDLVAAGNRRQEALLALASSDEPNAVRFVAQAKSHSVLSITLRSAIVQAGASNLYYGG